MNIHLIAIGGSAMHNLALALHNSGHTITGSDDEILEPSKSRLQKAGILPNTIGWDEARISTKLDAVIVGMHARSNNPELLKAQELALKIYSYPEYIYECTKHKTRIVVGGSHGKTTITSMILHVCKILNIEVDYMVGAQLKGYDTMVKLSNNNKFVVLEGDEYLSSPTDLRPKFHLYHPHFAIISGIAWDHINVFPTFENYVEQFEKFINLIEPNGTLAYCELDEEVKRISIKPTVNNITKTPYGLPKYKVENGVTTIAVEGENYILNFFGKHNLLNMQAAKEACTFMGIAAHDFYSAIQSFTGADKRLELVAENSTSKVFKDFAHSPSKLKATIEAVKEQYKDKRIIACMELHTFSSLNQKFLSEYHGSMDSATIAVVYFNLHTIEHKKLPVITTQQVFEAFNNNNIVVINDSSSLQDSIINLKDNNTIYLMMSSGNFDGINLSEFANKLLAP
jgi:UDP-N-acetylmuramate: L-alanyl-gamma-D-glutamyl-meso-diaminopimelate ligase